MKRYPYAQYLHAPHKLNGVPLPYLKRNPTKPSKLNGHPLLVSHNLNSGSGHTLNSRFLHSQQKLDSFRGQKQTKLQLRQPSLANKEPATNPLVGDIAEHDNVLDGNIPAGEDVPGDAEIPGNEDVPVSEILPVDGDLLVGGDIPVGEYFTADGDVPAGGDAPVGDIPLGGDDPMGVDMTLEGSVTLGGDVTLGGNVTLKEDVTLAGNITLGGGESLGGDLPLGGNPLLGENVTVRDVTLEKDVTLGGDVNLEGDATLGDDSFRGDLSLGNDVLLGGDVHLEEYFPVGDEPRGKEPVIDPETGDLNGKIGPLGAAGLPEPTDKDGQTGGQPSVAVESMGDEGFDIHMTEHVTKAQPTPEKQLVETHTPTTIQAATESQSSAELIKTSSTPETMEVILSEETMKTTQMPTTTGLNIQKVLETALVLQSWKPGQDRIQLEEVPVDKNGQIAHLFVVKELAQTILDGCPTPPYCESEEEMVVMSTLPEPQVSLPITFTITPTTTTTISTTPPPPSLPPEKLLFTCPKYKCKKKLTAYATSCGYAVPFTTPSPKPAPVMIPIPEPAPYWMPLAFWGYYNPYYNPYQHYYKNQYTLPSYFTTTSIAQRLAWVVDEQARFPVRQI